LVFGRLGDLIGRKYTFLLTLVLMGGSTFAIGLIPSFETIGYAAPILVLILRLVQGLALGGEYGGAATYVAEHSPAHQRGFWTSWIQTTATLGLFLSLGIIVFTKNSMTTEQWEAWGWRIPFLISILLVGVSIYIRLNMKESPLFTKLKAEGKTSVNPLKESFRHRANVKMVLLALFGAVMGQGVIWYTGQFYAQNFLETKCMIAFDSSRYMLLWAILFATPFFIVFGAWSDKVGRKWIMIAGMLLGVFCYRPIYSEFLVHSDAEAMMKTEVTTSISNPVVKREIIKGKSDSLITTTTRVSLANQASFNLNRTDTIFADMAKGIKAAAVTYTDRELPKQTFWYFVLLVFVQIIFVTMVYGPIAAFLVELFPTRIRYTSMSLPYHIGNGVFGGLVPFIATLITNFKGMGPLDGLYYPIGVAAVCALIGIVYLRNKRDENVMD
jgi:MFS family permease